MMEIIHEGYYHRPCSAQVITKEKYNEQVHTFEVRMGVIILISQAHSTLLTITALQRTRRTPQQVDFEENNKNLSKCNTQSTQLLTTVRHWIVWSAPKVFSSI